MFLPELSDAQLWITVSRLANAVFLLLVAIELVASARLVDNKRLTKLIWKAAMFTLSFFFLKVVAGFLDGYAGFTIPWSSNLVNFVFWGIIIYRLDRIRVILKSDKNTETRQELRALADALLDKLEVAKENLTTLKHSVDA